MGKPTHADSHVTPVKGVCSHFSPLSLSSLKKLLHFLSLAPLSSTTPFQPWGSGLKGDTESVASWSMWQGYSSALQVRDGRMLRPVKAACAGSLGVRSTPLGGTALGSPGLEAARGRAGGGRTRADPSLKFPLSPLCGFCSSWSPVGTKEERGCSSEMS